MGIGLHTIGFVFVIERMAFIVLSVKFLSVKLWDRFAMEFTFFPLVSALFKIRYYLIIRCILYNRIY